MATDEDDRHSTVRFVISDGRVHLGAEELIAVVEKNVEDDCYCSSCSWMRKVLIPGIRAATFEQEALLGLRQLPTSG